MTYFLHMLFFCCTFAAYFTRTTCDYIFFVAHVGEVSY